MSLEETMKEFGVGLHYGVIEEIEGSSHRVKVKIEYLDDMITPWLDVIEPSTQANKTHGQLEKDAQVSILLDARGEVGVVLGCVYSEVDQPPITDPDIWHKAFKDGTVIEYDPNTHKLKVEAKGEVTLKADGPIAIEGLNITIKGTATVKVEAPIIELESPITKTKNQLIQGLVQFT